MAAPFLFLRLYFIFTKGLRQMEFNPSFERLDVVNDNISLIQNTNGLTFGTDALLLASYMRQTNGIGLELGSGSGIISLLAATRGKCKHIWAAEVQKEYAQLTRRNVALNHLEEKISVIEADIRQTEKLGEVGSYDVVFTNPPYMTADSGRACDNDLKNRARHELCGTVADFICTASRMLKYGGCFYIVLRPDRMTDFFVACRGADLEPKRLTAVFARPLLAPSMFLAECKRGARAGLIFTRPLLLSNEEDMDYIMGFRKSQ